MRGLKFEQKPDYQYLRRIFKDLFYRRECDTDLMFDWTFKHVFLSPPIYNSVNRCEKRH